MKRRKLLGMLALTGASSFSTLYRKALAQAVTSYEVYGEGPTIILFRRTDNVLDGYLQQLTKDYRVVVINPFPDDESLVDLFTPEYVCKEILKVADETGSDHFAFFGYSWRGSVALQLAARTDRLSALICGGWPPLGAPYKEMPIETAANAKAYGTPGIYTTYYNALVNWPEQEVVSGLTCPRMVIAGSDDVITTNNVTARIGPLIAEHREELEAQGWKVHLIDGYRHDLVERSEIVVPLIRKFLDPLLLGKA